MANLAKIMLFQEGFWAEGWLVTNIFMFRSLPVLLWALALMILTDRVLQQFGFGHT